MTSGLRYFYSTEEAGGVGRKVLLRLDDVEMFGEEKDM